MPFNKTVLVLLFAFWGIIACSDDESSGEVVRRIDENGISFSPTMLQGTFEYLRIMKPEMARVISLDNKLNPIDSVEVPAESTYYYEPYRFSLGLRDYEYPYVKIVSVFSAEGKKKMEFAQYAHLSSNNTQLRQNIFAALAADRIEVLVKEKKKNFDDAEAEVFAELGEAFGLDLSNINEQSFSPWTTGFKWGIELKGLAPYVYCRHEISDSLFYHDFKEIRDYFTETGKIKSSVLVRAADAWLSTYDSVLENGSDRLCRSKTRDTLAYLNSIDYAFLEKVYGIEFPWSAGDSFDPVQITEKSSAYYKRYFVMDNVWRLKSLLEDEIGLCRYNDKKFISYKEENYLCEKESNVWRKEANVDTLLTYGYGKCDGYNINHFEYLGDLQYACRCRAEYYHDCAWEPTWGNSEFTQDDPLYKTALSMEAQHLFGVCGQDSVLSGEKREIDSAFVECYDSWWTVRDSFTYYLGDCYFQHNGKLGIIHDRYYQCQRDTSGSAHWTEVVPPVYFGDTCTTYDVGKVVQYEGIDYICESDACKDVDPDDFCWDFGTWRKLDDIEDL